MKISDMNLLLSDKYNLANVQNVMQIFNSIDL